jgi:hypothetical protein
MTIDGQDPGLDYDPCLYGGSSCLFRGPAVPLDDPYVAVIGGSEVFGRYVPQPFSARLADLTGRRVVNLGVANGGLDAFLTDEPLQDVIRGAETVIVQAMGAANLSNRFYSVHPRRNDRYLRHADAMAQTFPGIDFSDFVFTRHMLTTLRSRAPGGFSELLHELRTAWRARMRLLLTRLPGRKVLLWVEYDGGGVLGPEPLFVTGDMLQGLDDAVDTLVHCDVGAEMTEAAMEGMVYPQVEAPLASRMLTPAAHRRIAEALARTLRDRAEIAA